MILFGKITQLVLEIWKHNGFIKSVQAIRIEYQLPDNLQEIAEPPNPLKMVQTQINLNLEVTLYKSDTSTDVLRCCALETIHLNYPVSEWLHIYTDGSFFDACMTAGSGVFSTLISFDASAEKYMTTFDHEVEAIRIALKQLLVLEN